MKFNDWLLEKTGYDFLTDKEANIINAERLHIIGTCRDCKIGPKECVYFSHIFKDENSVTIAGALLSFGCTHWEDKNETIQ